MKRIGIIGTENSHAMHFAKYINLPNPESGELLYDDVRVVGVYGPDPDSARAIHDAVGVDFIAEAASEFIGKVDAMIICNRKGSLHLKYARPLIQEGIPLFIDKPITANVEEAQTLVREAQANNVPICGGSGCKYAWDVQLLANKSKQWQATGKLLSASMNFSADRDSEYDGFYFYAPHLTEMALAAFGPNPLSVQAFESAGGVLAVLRYQTFDASLHFTKNSGQSTATLYGKQSNSTREIDISLIYQQELALFIDMLRTGHMPLTYEALIQPVVIIDAILQSLATQSEVTLA